MITTPVHAVLRRPLLLNHFKHLEPSWALVEQKWGGTIAQDRWLQQNYNSAVLGKYLNTYRWISLRFFWLLNGVILKTGTACTLSCWKRTFQHLNGIIRHRCRGGPTHTCHLLWTVLRRRKDDGVHCWVTAWWDGTGRCTSSPCLIRRKLKPYLFTKRGLPRLHSVTLYQEPSSCFFPEQSWKSWNCHNVLLSLAKQILLHQIKTQLHSSTLTQGYA